MFNFIFDGKIGDILAPVVPSNKLFLAIQHHENDKVHQLMLNNDIQIIADGGYAAIHVACRYNNRFALEMIISKGVSVESVDRAGNTPLHYASKYGHLELCRYLIEVGASPGRKNNSHQTPYDAAAEHHTVRQYLLPLQFQAERNAAESSGDYSVHSQAHMGQTSDGYQMQTNHNFNYSHGTAAPGAYGTNSPPPPQGYAPHPAAHFGMAVPMAAQSESHTFAHNPSPPPAAGPTGVATFGPPTVNFPTNTSASAPMYNNVRPVAATTRIIQPDGFHSSASDPALQKKYGHIQLTNNIAPPPTVGTFQSSAGPSGPYGMYGAPPGGGVPGCISGGGGHPVVGTGPGPAPAGIYSRYVPYDAHTNSAAPIPSYTSAPAPAPTAAASAPPAQSQFTMPGFSGSRQATLPTHTQQVPPARTTLSGAAPSALAPMSMTLPQQQQTPGSADGAALSPSSTTSSAAPSSARLLGNKGITSGGEDLFKGGLASPSAEVDIITANSSSSAVL